MSGPLSTDSRIIRPFCLFNMYHSIMLFQESYISFSSIGGRLSALKRIALSARVVIDKINFNDVFFGSHVSEKSGVPLNGVSSSSCASPVVSQMEKEIACYNTFQSKPSFQWRERNGYSNHGGIGARGGNADMKETFNAHDNLYEWAQHCVHYNMLDYGHYKIGVDDHAKIKMKKVVVNEMNESHEELKRNRMCEELKEHEASVGESHKWRQASPSNMMLRYQLYQDVLLTMQMLIEAVQVIPAPPQNFPLLQALLVIQEVTPTTTPTLLQTTQRLGLGRHLCSQNENPFFTKETAAALRYAEIKF
ncbi:hypothetical protein Tco_0282416 [Tanacetum coccineum]